MDNSIDNVKSLIINGVEYAKYEIQEVAGKPILFFKVLKQISTISEQHSENELAIIIQIVEQKAVEGLSFLNI